MGIKIMSELRDVFIWFTESIHLNHWTWKGLHVTYISKIALPLRSSLETKEQQTDLVDASHTQRNEYVFFDAPIVKYVFFAKAFEGQSLKLVKIS